MNIKNPKEELQKIFDTEKDIDIPAEKQTDYFWLLGHFNKANFNYPKRALIIMLVKKILKEELKK